MKGRNMVKALEAKMISTARAYAHTIMGCTRTGLDKFLTARTLWETCAIPTVLYGTETMVVSKATISELDKIQGAVARFILQLPASASKVAAYLDTGMKPINLRLKARQLMFFHVATHPKKDTIIRRVVEAVLADGTDPWTAQVRGEIGKLLLRDFFAATKKQIKDVIKQNHVDDV